MARTSAHFQMPSALWHWVLAWRGCVGVGVGVGVPSSLHAPICGRFLGVECAWCVCVCVCVCAFVRSSSACAPGASSSSATCSQADGHPASPRYSVYLLYWYKTGAKVQILTLRARRSHVSSLHNNDTEVGCAGRHQDAVRVGVRGAVRPRGPARRRVSA